MRRLLLFDAQGLDLLTFLLAANLVAVSGESNVVMRGVAGSVGIGGLIVAKGLAAVLFGWFGTRWEARYQRHSFLTFGIWVGLVGSLGNVVSIGVLRGALIL
jgi:hypothetical protein